MREKVVRQDTYFIHKGRNSVNITDTISERMSDVFKPQRKFISVLLTTVMLMRGNVSFRNMSRYSKLCEKTFSRQFRNPSDFAEFNMIGTQMVVPLIH